MLQQLFQRLTAAKSLHFEAGSSSHLGMNRMYHLSATIWDLNASWSAIPEPALLSASIRNYSYVCLDRELLILLTQH